jgi:hypothetical protein
MARHKRKGEREPNPAMLSNLPTTFEQAQEAEIIAIMRDWPDRLGQALNTAGLGNGLNDREAGHRLWQAKFEQALATSDDPDTLPTIVYLAEQGHVAAKRTLRDHASRLLEDPKADLPSSVRSYLGRLINELVPAHPKDSSEIIEHLFRNIGIVVMVDAGAARWPHLPKLNSSARRHSVGYFVSVVMTERGIELSERQIRKIHQSHATLAARLAKFLIGDQTF